MCSDNQQMIDMLTWRLVSSIYCIATVPVLTCYFPISIASQLTLTAFIPVLVTSFPTVVACAVISKAFAQNSLATLILNPLLCCISSFFFSASAIFFSALTIASFASTTFFFYFSHLLFCYLEQKIIIKHSTKQS